MTKAKKAYVEWLQGEGTASSTMLQLTNKLEKEFNDFAQVAVGIKGKIDNGDLTAASKQLGEDCHKTAGLLLNTISELKAEKCPIF